MRHPEWTRPMERRLGADAGDAGDGQGMEFGVCGDEVVRSGGGGEGEVQGVGGLHARGDAEVGETLGDVG